ncbi:hypothetical protein SAMN05192562_11514 [Kosakonia arachidis]|uniref:Diguanylate cyclase (GGDEF) domain-containing protein n=1 Tax=Kosakonia arachidis TaxID=551989 RepID=A0A1I7EB22_9ENTR|nr:hypothetical protein SAMN05192562_11514 [Kosakonia arachidis]
MIFSETYIENSKSYLGEWRSNVANRVWCEGSLVVTFSTWPGAWHMESLEQLVTDVDEALYQAKQQGNNRILLANAN